jgi:hypothetical protein
MRVFLRKIGARLGNEHGASKALVMAVVTAAAFGLMTAAAFATPTPGETAITDGTSTVVDSLSNIALAVLPLVAGVLAITIGWRLAVRFLRGAK